MKYVFVGLIIISLVITCFIGSINVKGNVENVNGYPRFYNSDNSFEGYTLFNPEFSKNAYLINNDGKIVSYVERKS